MKPRIETEPQLRPSSPGSGRAWPTWAVGLASLGLLYHLAAILAGALAARPSSELEVRALRYFKNYYSLINQGYGYRYYARLDTTVDPGHSRRWGTPVIVAELDFEEGGDGKAPRVEEVRLPAREHPWPRLRFQRQLDLAYHLASDPRWAASYARHLCRSRGCAKVSIYTREHQIPDLARVQEAALGRGTERLDLEAEETYTPRVLLGAFRCSDF